MTANFKSIGNLAFYDDWSPDYFYFNTLNDAGEIKEGHEYWDSEEASRIANIAKSHALNHQFVNYLDENKATDEMITRFTDIVKFL